MPALKSYAGLYTLLGSESEGARTEEQRFDHVIHPPSPTSLREYTVCVYTSLLRFMVHLNLSCHPVEQSNVLHSELGLDKSLNKLCVFQLTCLSYISPTHRSQKGGMWSGQE